MGVYSREPVEDRGKLDMRLVPLNMLEAAEPALTAELAASREHFAVDPADRTYGRAFKYYLLFTHWPSLLPDNLSAEQIFYNRYYWFRRFASLYQEKNGFDAGIEQQTDQLLEYADSALDWTVIEQIDAQVRKEAEGRPDTP